MNNELLDLISRNSYQELFIKIRVGISTESANYEELILLESRYNDLLSERYRGVYSNEDYNRELNRIRKSLINLIRIVSSEIDENRKTKKKKYNDKSNEKNISLLENEILEKQKVIIAPQNILKIKEMEKEVLYSALDLMAEFDLVAITYAIIEIKIRNKEYDLDNIISGEIFYPIFNKYKINFHQVEDCEFEYRIDLLDYIEDKLEFLTSLNKNIDTVISNEEMKQHIDEINFRIDKYKQ